MNTKLNIAIIVFVILLIYKLIKKGSQMTISKKGLELLKEHEGFSPTIYKDAAGIPTIGYGTALFSQQAIDKFTGKSITKKEAENLLKTHVKGDEETIREAVKVDLNQNQFDALVSFVYNVGRGAFLYSTLLKKLNAGDYDGAAYEFTRWVFADGQKLAGLEKRRNDEQKLFLS